MRRILLLAAVGCVLSAAGPATAGAQLDELYDEYLSLGAVRGCSHAKADLEDALKDIPADIRAYDPGFAIALTAALERRAAGCEAEEERIQSAIPLLSGTTEAPDGSPGPVGAAVSGLSTTPDDLAAEPAGKAWLAAFFGALAVAIAVLVFAVRPRGPTSAAHEPTDERTRR